MLTDKEILELLESHTPAIRSFYDEALLKLNEIMNTMGVRPYGRFKAITLNNLILEKAKNYFRNIDGIDINEKYESLILIFNDKFKSRFKKLKKINLLSSNIETVRNTNLIQASLFPQYQPNVLVEIGYWTNDTNTEYEKILIVKRVDNIAIPLMEILPIKDETIKAVPATEVVLPDNFQEQQLKIKKG